MGVLRNAAIICLDRHNRHTALRSAKINSQEGVRLSVEMTPFFTAIPWPDDGAPTGYTGRPLETVITVTNKGKGRAFNPTLTIEFSGEAVSDKIRLKAGPAKPRQDDDAAFFDIKCTVERQAVSCPLGYADQNEEGRSYLEPGESRGILVEFAPSEPGALTMAAKAAAKDRQNRTVEANASQSTTFVGPVLGLVLVGTTPEAYGFIDGYIEGSRVPLHEGNEITLQFAIRNSEKGGGAQDIDLSFYSRTGEVLSVWFASGGAVPCGRPKVTTTEHSDCAIGDLDPGSTVKINVTVRYRGWLELETDVRAGRSTAEHVYKIAVDIQPLVTTKFFPPPSATISPGQEISAVFKFRHRGRGKVDRAVLRLWAQGWGFTEFKINRVVGCKSLTTESGGTSCALEYFSAEDVQEITVVLDPVPEGAEGKELGLSWTLKVPGYRIPHASTGNEKGYVKYDIAARFADLFVAEWLAAEDRLPGGPKIERLDVGNKGTWPEDNVALKLRLSVRDENGARDRDNLTRAYAVISNSEKYGDTRRVPCMVTGNDAACALGTLSPRWQPAVIIFEWNSGDVAAGSYTYEAWVGEGLGERGKTNLTKNNSLSAGADIVTTREKSADLTVYNSDKIEKALAGIPQSFDLSVVNVGTIAQENVVFNLKFDVSTNQVLHAGTRFLTNVAADISSWDYMPFRKVPCVLAAGTASCALGRLAPGDAAQILIEWDPGVVLTGSYRYEAYVSEGADEAANKTLEDNKTTGGAAIVRN